MSIRDARFALTLLLEVIAGFAAAAVFVQIFGAQREGPSVIAVAAVVLGAAALGYFTEARDEGARRAVIAATTLSVVVLLVIAQSEYAAAPWDLTWLRSLPTPGEPVSDHARAVIAGIIALTLLWVWGVAIGARADDAGSALTTVLSGLAAVALAAVISPAVRGPDLFAALALAYLPLALLLLAAHQVTDPDRPVREAVQQSGRWLAAMIALTLALAAIAAAIDPRSLGALEPTGPRLLDALAPLRGPLSAVGEVIARFLLAPIFAVIASIFHIFPSLSQHKMPPQPQQAPPTVVEHPHDSPMWQVIAGRILAGAAIALVVASGPALIWLALRRLRRKKRVPAETHEGIESAPDPGGVLAGLLRRLRLPYRQGATSIAVRRLYYEMLADAAAAGVERRPSATPLQFAPRLDAHYGSDAPSAISSAFTRSRYGREEFDEPFVRDLRQSWQAARSARTSHTN